MQYKHLNYKSSLERRWIGQGGRRGGDKNGDRGGGKEIVTNGDKGGRGGQNPGFFVDVIVEWPLRKIDTVTCLFAIFWASVVQFDFF